MSNYICPHNCAYRTNAGYCGKTGGYESCQYIKYLEKLEKEKTNIKPYAGKRTIADRIRSMTDEELAQWLCYVAGWLPTFEGRTHPILEWLKQEVER